MKISPIIFRGLILLILLTATKLSAQKEHRVTTLTNIPEFKVDFPYTKRRTSKLALYYRIDHEQPNVSKAAIEAIEKCAKGAIKAGILVGITSENLSTGAAAMKAYVKNCLVAKFKDLFNIHVYTKKECGEWKKCKTLLSYKTINH